MTVCGKAIKFSVLPFSELHTDKNQNKILKKVEVMVSEKDVANFVFSSWVQV